MNPDISSAKELVVLSKAIVRVAQLLDIPDKVLSSVLGINQQTVARLKRNEYVVTRTRKEWVRGCLLVRIYRSLDTIAGNMAKEWLHGENSDFGGKKPLEIIQTAAGLELVYHYLEAHRVP